ncbi:MAG TPA: sigma factor [Rhodothermales bacterium]
MDEHGGLAGRFEANRTHLRTVACRMLGSRSEADDAVQEPWLRLSRSGTSGVENLGGWMTTVVARVCLDMLRSRKSRREEPGLRGVRRSRGVSSLDRCGEGDARTPARAAEGPTVTLSTRVAAQR